MELCESNNFRKRKYDIIDRIDNISNNKRKRENYDDNENIINKRVKYIHYHLDLTIETETNDIDINLINQFNSLQLRKRKLNYDIESNVENNSKFVCIYKCSIHDNDKNICTIYNCNGIYSNNNQLFMNYIN
jgi:DNA-directed RNA polymerase beta subunit